MNEEQPRENDQAICRNEWQIVFVHSTTGNLQAKKKKKKEENSRES